MERCFVMLKPGVVNRRIVGEIISRLEKKGLSLIGMKMMNISEDLASRHYAEHKEKSFFKVHNKSPSVIVPIYLPSLLIIGIDEYLRYSIFSKACLIV